MIGLHLIYNTIMFHNLKKKLFAVVFVGVLSFVVFVLLPKQQTDAVGFLPFGGPISGLMFCPCSNNFLITAAAPNPAMLVFQLGVSHAFSFGQVYRPGPYVLGNYSPGGVCAVFVAVGCAPIPTNGTVTIVGTSL